MTSIEINTLQLFSSPHMFMESKSIPGSEVLERLRVVYDLRTSPEDSSLRMLDSLESGAEVPIHRKRINSYSRHCKMLILYNYC